MNNSAILDDFILMSRSLDWAQTVVVSAAEVDDASLAADHLEMAARQCRLLADAALRAERQISRKAAATRKIMLVNRRIEESEIA